MKKVFIALVTGFSMLLVGMGVSWLAGYLIPGLKTEYENGALFRLWTDPLMSVYWIHPFIVSFILLWIWNFTKPLFIAETFLMRGIAFGFAYWIVTIPGMLMSYGSFQLSGFMVISWSASNFLQALCAGILFARFQANEN